jgi:DNA-binding response OmpR family regulator
VSFSVLLVEEDQSRSMAMFLAKSGFVIRRAASIAQAEALLSEPVDMLVVDLELPDGDGLAFCRRVRSYMSCGVILCLGPSERELRISGLREGADACLVRPVDAEELEATLISVHRRLRSPPSPLLVQPLPNPWLLDRERRLLTAPNGASACLNALETLLLQTLFGHPERIAGRDDLVTLLAAEAPGYSMPRLEALVSRLRAKATGKCAMKLPLVSSYGRGYRFDGHVRML